MGMLFCVHVNFDRPESKSVAKKAQFDRYFIDFRVRLGVLNFTFVINNSQAYTFGTRYLSLCCRSCHRLINQSINQVFFQDHIYSYVFDRSLWINCLNKSQLK